MKKQSNVLSLFLHSIEMKIQGNAYFEKLCITEIYVFFQFLQYFYFLVLQFFPLFDPESHFHT